MPVTIRDVFNSTTNQLVHAKALNFGFSSEIIKPERNVILFVLNLWDDFEFLVLNVWDII